MKFSAGYNVPKESEINEEFEIREKSIIANVSIDNIKQVLIDFLDTLDEPLFFILELPLTRDEENEYRKSDIDSFHKSIYYIDGCYKEDILYILNNSGELLINDGSSNFGFASHKIHTEIMVMKYNIVYIYTKDINKYSKFYNKYGFNEVNKIKTAWNTFSKDCYGESKLIKINDKDIYSLLDDYQDWNIYRGEVREG